MKLRNLFFALLALPLAFVACEPEPTPEPEPQPEQIVLILTSDEVMNFSAAGGAGEITYAMDLKGQDLQLTATSEAEWISDITVDTNITFTVAANDGAAREDKIVATCGTKSFEVTVKQAAKVAVPALVITSENPLEVDHNEQMGTITYTVENPKEGVSVTASCSANWISQLAVQEANSKVVFLVAANSGAAREAVVTLTYGLLEEKVTVKQSEFVAEAPVINVESKLDVAAEGGAQSLAYSVDNKVEGVELTATCEAEWISNIAVAAEAITFDVAANEDIMREATLVLTYGAVTAEVTITQLPVGANEDMVYSVFQIVDCWASMDNGGAQWDVTFVEHDATLGDMQTRISFALAEPNLQRVADGVYSVENGGILINSASLNGFSSYRTNTSIDTDTFFKRFTAEWFYKFMKVLGVDVVYNHADYRLTSKRVLEEFANFKEVNLFLRGMFPLLGFESDIVYYDRQARFAGKTKYPLKKMLNFAWDGISSFSVKPLRMICGLGFIILFISIAIIIYSLIRKVTGNTVSGWTFLSISIWFIGGLQMICIGIIGEYIGKIYAETKARPRYIIEEDLSKRMK